MNFNSKINLSLNYEETLNQLIATLGKKLMIFIKFKGSNSILNSFKGSKIEQKQNRAIHVKT